MTTKLYRLRGLEWVRQCEWAWKADSLAGAFYVTHVGQHYVTMTPRSVSSAVYDTLEAAQSAAEAHYRERMEAGLEVVPQAASMDRLDASMKADEIVSGLCFCEAGCRKDACEQQVADLKTKIQRALVNAAKAAALAGDAKGAVR